MKKRITLLLFAGFILLLNARAQDSPGSYLFYDFLDGTATTKTGNTLQSKFNYNFETEKITFVGEDKIILALTNPERLSHIDINGRRFVQGEKEAFYEKIEITGGEYYIRWKSNNNLQGAHVGYGFYSPSTSTKNVTPILDSSHLPVAEAKEEHEHRIKEELQPMYYIKSNDKFVRITSPKALTKIYKSQKTEIEQFAKENKINFKQQGDIARMLEYVYSLE
ncbi:hypothetical protein [Dysgonomonas sp. 25]|uniref:hypothetical protein n=1 Tax=Dysgonomonas sp. 25 TaxID=2302933 RepID=UPI0013D647C7|nr:hypothetical protein [Dysgonomonas sp. 25]NDV69214.1 hypothetical protein [Dysgonomonas sp. 25]